MNNMSDCTQDDGRANAANACPRPNDEVDMGNLQDIQHGENGTLSNMVSELQNVVSDKPETSAQNQIALDNEKINVLPNNGEQEPLDNELSLQPSADKSERAGASFSHITASVDESQTSMSEETAQGFATGIIPAPSSAMSNSNGADNGSSSSSEDALGTNNVHPMPINGAVRELTHNFDHTAPLDIANMVPFGFPARSYNCGFEVVVGPIKQYLAGEEPQEPTTPNVADVEDSKDVDESEVPDFEMLITEALKTFEGEKAKKQPILEHIMNNHVFSINEKQAYTFFSSKLKKMVDLKKIIQTIEDGHRYYQLAKRTPTKSSIAVQNSETMETGQPDHTYSTHYLGNFSKSNVIVCRSAQLFRGSERVYRGGCHAGGPSTRQQPERAEQAKQADQPFDLD